MASLGIWSGEWASERLASYSMHDGYFSSTTPRTRDSTLSCAAAPLHVHEQDDPAAQRPSSWATHTARAPSIHTHSSARAPIAREAVGKAFGSGTTLPCYGPLSATLPCVWPQSILSWDGAAAKRIRSRLCSREDGIEVVTPTPRLETTTQIEIRPRSRCRSEDGTEGVGDSVDAVWPLAQPWRAASLPQ